VQNLTVNAVKTFLPPDGVVATPGLLGKAGRAGGHGENVPFKRRRHKN
jgi:hypothetical protein